jgi:hypothetical protein
MPGRETPRGRASRTGPNAKASSDRFAKGAPSNMALHTRNGFGLQQREAVNALALLKRVVRQEINCGSRKETSQRPLGLSQLQV